MPNPDVRRYYDMTLFDRDSQSIYLEAINYARTALPEFQPREGSIETVLLQAMALEVAELVRSVNRLPGGILQVLLRLLDVQRSEGTLPTATVHLSGATATEYDLPAGIRLFYQQSIDTDPFVLVTDTAVRLTHAKLVDTIVDASSTATVTTVNRHGFSTGQSIIISGVTAPDDTDLNGTYTVTVVDETTFTFTSSSVTDGTTTGTAIYATPPTTHPATAFVGATGAILTEEFNGLSANTPLDLLSVLPQVASAKLATKVTGGALPESDDQYFARATGLFARMNASLVTADNYTQWISSNEEFPRVYRATTLDTTDYDRTTLAGAVLLVVAPIDAASDNLLSGVGDQTTVSTDPDWGEKDEIRVAAEAISHMGLTVNVADPMLVTVKVEATLKANETVAGTAAASAVTDALESLFSVNSWDWHTEMTTSELVARISRVTDATGAFVAHYTTATTMSVTGSSIPAGKVVGTVSSSSYSSPTLTVTTSAAHGLSASPVVEYVALKIGGTWETFLATRTGTTTFTVPRATTASPTNWVRVASVAADGDLTIHDPAPLVSSGDHEVTVL